MRSGFRGEKEKRRLPYTSVSDFLEKDLTFRYRSRAFSKGNPTLTVCFKEYMREVSRQTATYTPKGAHRINPWLLNQLALKFIAKTDIQGLQLYTMTLVGINLFLREEEIADLRVEDLVPSLCIINGEHDIRMLLV